MVISRNLWKYFRAAALPFAPYLLVFLAIAIAAQKVGGAYSSDFNWADEASHYINGLLISDYLAAGLPSNPIAFATEYYRHFPKVAIGHWPPFYYVVEAAVFTLLGPGQAAALLLQALTASATAALIATVVGRLGGWIAGLAGGLATLAAPDIILNIQGIMLDVPYTFFAIVAALAWAQFLFKGTWPWSAAFALASSACIMTKGNGYCLALVPMVSIVLSGRYRLLRDWRLWLALPIVAILTIPWYVLTYKLASTFVYHWGTTFTVKALVEYSAALPKLVGFPALALGAAGAVVILSQGPWDWRKTVGHSFISLCVAVFIYHCIIPVDVDPRYLTALVPAVMGLSFFGADWLARSLLRPHLSAAIALSFALVIAGEVEFRDRPAHAMGSAAQVILRAPEHNPLILVSSFPGGEGAMIVDVATEDRSRTYYVLRGFKALASGDFMGFDYRPRFATAAEAAQWVEKNGIGWVVIDTAPASLKWVHNAQLLDAAAAGRPGWDLVGRFSEPGGQTLVYRVASGFGGTPTDISALMRQFGPSNAIGNVFGR